MLNKLEQILLITRNSSLEEITKHVQKLREQKGKEKETIKLINEALIFGHDFVINLFFEEALTYQHMVMNDQSDKESLINMQTSILKAYFYIKKYNLVKWLSRYYRFLGRIEDYKRNYKKAIFYYKKAIKYVNFDPNPFRILELEGLLVSSIVSIGQFKKGVKLLKTVLEKFENSGIGKDLKSRDYKTWAIWKSGVVIRVLKTFSEKNVTFNKDFAHKLISDVRKDLKPETDFEYRIRELEEISMEN